MPAPAGRIIADRGEFIDALRHLQRGRVLVQVDKDGRHWGLDGWELQFTGPTLREYGLVDEFHNPDGFHGMRYYRLSPRGEAFAERALRAWRRQPLWARALARLTG